MDTATRVLVVIALTLANIIMTAVIVVGFGTAREISKPDAPAPTPTCTHRVVDGVVVCE